MEINIPREEVYQDLLEFKVTRESVSELLRVRRQLIDQEHSDLERINRAKLKAMDAIDNLFSGAHFARKK